MGGGVLGHVEVDDASAMVREHDENEENAQARGGHGEEVYRDQVPNMVDEDVRQVWDGGVRRFGSSRETVRSACPSPKPRPTCLAAFRSRLPGSLRVRVGEAAAVDDERLSTRL